MKMQKSFENFAMFTKEKWVELKEMRESSNDT